MPAAKGKQTIDTGVGYQINLKSGGGVGLSFSGPGNWRQLQDDRAFNGEGFEYQFLWDIPAHSGQNAFAIQIAPLPPTGPIALKIVTPPSTLPKAAPTPVKKLVDMYGQPLGKTYPDKISSQWMMI